MDDVRGDFLGPPKKSESFGTPFKEITEFAFFETVIEAGDMLIL